MILTRSDILRIAKLGYSPDDFTVKSGGFIRLKNVNGACFFLDRETLRCKIYNSRPIGCRLYPIIYDVERNVITVDKECPMHWTVGENDLIRARPVLARILWELGILRPGELPKLPKGSNS